MNMINELRRIMAWLLAGVMAITIFPNFIYASEFKASPKTDYASFFLEKCESEQWFIKEVESLLNDQQRSINTLKSASDLEFIYSLGLTGKGVSGKLPKAVGELKNLKHIFLGSNQITSLPKELYTLKNLETLDLSENRLTGSISPEIAQLTNLKVLSLYGNQLSGGIPDELGDLTNLTTLDISYNQLTGGIPSSIGNLQNLKAFLCSNNRLTGEIPVELTTIKSLKALLIWNNRLTGNVIPELGNLSSLEILDVSQNNFAGSLPDSISDIKTLQKFAARGNKLTGEIPAAYGELTNLHTFDINNNKIEGKIPESFALLTKLVKLDLSSNKLRWEITDIFSNMILLEKGYFNDNLFVGLVPDSLLLRQSTGSEVNINKNYLTGTNASKIVFNSDNFIDGKYNTQNDMYLKEYIQVPLSSTVNIYSEFKHLLAGTSEPHSGKVKLPVDGYVLNLISDEELLLEQFDIEHLDELFIISKDDSGLYIRLVKEVEKEEGIEFELRIIRNDYSDYSATKFKVGTEEGEIIEPIDPPDENNGGGSSGGGSTEAVKRLPENIDEETLPPFNLSENIYLHTAYISGYPDKTVRPDSSISREEAAMIFFNIIQNTDKNDEIPYGHNFTDLEPGRWSEQAIRYLTYKGILSGYEDGSFRPENMITRAEFVTVMSLMLRKSGGNGSAFNDTENHWASSYIKAISDLGFIVGYPDGSFKPQNHITRGEAVTAVNKMLGRKPDKNKIEQIDLMFTDINTSHWAYVEIVEAAVSHSYTIDEIMDLEFWTEEVFTGE